MRIISLNVGMPRLVDWQGAEVFTGIFKEPVATPLALGFTNFVGDGQGDLTVHGGVSKAVYAYPAEYYEAWRARLGRELPLGIFGENLTTEGLFEDDVCIGDEFLCGTAVLVARQPRLPCFKLGLRFNDVSMVKTFVDVGKPGIYFSVKQEGIVGPGDSMTCIHRDEHRLSVTQLFQMIIDKETSHDALRKAIEVPALTDNWRTSFHKRLEE